MKKIIFPLIILAFSCNNDDTPLPTLSICKLEYYQNASSTAKYLHQYNTSSQLAKIERSGDDEIDTYTFFYEGEKLTKEVHFTKGEGFESNIATSYYYNAAGELTRATVYDEAAGEQSSNTTYRFKSLNGKLVQSEEIIKFSATDSQYVKETYAYPSLTRVERWEYVINPTVTDSSFTVYEFDMFKKPSHFKYNIPANRRAFLSSGNLVKVFTAENINNLQQLTLTEEFIYKYNDQGYPTSVVSNGETAVYSYTCF